MHVNFDTKEKFTVITPEVEDVTADLAVQLRIACEAQLQKAPNNVVLNLQPVKTIDDDAAKTITEVQQNFYEQSTSFVVCGMKDEIEQKFDSLELLDYLNFTPTESEAWDIVQMEEIERELLDSDDVEFETE